MTISFADLKLSAPIATALADAGYTSPTPVQLQSIPAALDGKDLLVSAQTGSGKTAAFLLPSLEKAIQKSTKPGKGPRVLVLTPTRELAQQVEENAKVYGQNMRWLRTVTLVGGTSFGYQTRSLSRPIDVIVATPGRLMDHMRQGRIDFSRLEVLILDEADRMLDMGFIEDIETIVAATPKERQTLLFSATLDGTVGKLAARLTTDPVRIEVERVQEESKIEEQLMYCDDFRHKDRIMDHILRDTNIDQCVIFTATKAFSEQLADDLYEKGYAAACLHGDMPQNWRNRTLNDLRTGRIKILVATDVAARGIDVPTITHVINYDLPKQAEDYVHRIGRTGRAGRSGIAISFAEVKEHMKVSKIERYLNRKLPEAVIEGMEPTRRKPKPSAGAGRRGGNSSFGDRRRSGGAPGTGGKPAFGEKRYGGRGNAGGSGRPRSGGASTGTGAPRGRSRSTGSSQG
ncbi:MAG: DEAD/DEAH box helicase [Neisseriaceae bacterium]|nr:DEAD/DEAH box helicase [Neisseriaceae bacterium]MBP6861410.1 DEAD/DEAH box helicase [Neisseriaceae bacterium]